MFQRIATLIQDSPLLCGIIATALVVGSMYVLPEGGVL